MPTALRSATNEPRGAGNSKFGETRTAPIRSFVKGNTCQEMQFDNDKGIYVKGALVPCEAESKRNGLADVMPLLPGSNGSAGKGRADEFDPRLVHPLAQNAALSHTGNLKAHPR